MDTSSDSGSSPTNQPVVPFALGQGSNAANQAIRQENDHQANQARYGLPNMIAASSHAQPQVYMESSISFSKQVTKATTDLSANDDMPDPVAFFLFLVFIILIKNDN
ncbi:unnamed protein product [Porites evermanni]|uniref:Uncharacterized protein n=1 Tax=Porites evermanni TaxID=104178 RepID=A0ABN8SMD8_9CNID|nr:unnamed protein product [Porites evermanni]